MDRIRTFAKDKRIRLPLAVVIITATLGLFGFYLVRNPSVLTNVTNLKPSTITLLTVAYVGTVVSNAFVLWASLRLIGKRVGFAENMALTGYSSVVNFFGPLQSGPGFRAIYLKSKHGVTLKRFLYATIIFYGFFAAINGLVILTATLLSISPSAQPLAVVSILLITISIVGLAANSARVRTALNGLRLANPYVWLIGLGALLVTLTTAMAYFVELRHVDSAITPAQTIVYTAAANLALFVSLTPGAIGFRESFLLLSQRLHEIPTDIVIAASVIDRAFYVVFLLAMFIVLLLIGVRGRITDSIKSRQD